MKSPVAIAGVLLTMLLLSLGLTGQRLVLDLKNSVYGILVRNNARPLTSDRVTIVDIDEESLRRYGQWPWSRYILADLTHRVFDAGARVLAFDVMFAEPDRTSPALLRDDLARRFNVQLQIGGLPEDLHNFDAVFARALAVSNTVLGCYMHELRTEEDDKGLAPDPSYRGLFYFKGTGNPDEHLFKAHGITLSIAELGAAAGNSGAINCPPDFDNVVRSVPLVWAFGAKRAYPSLALEAARMYLGIPQIGVEHDEDGLRGLRLNERFIPTDGDGRLVINYHQAARKKAHWSTFPTVSAADLLDGRVPSSSLAGRVVLVGTSAAGLVDTRATPVAREFPGVEIQATIVENILSGDFLRHPAWLTNFDFVATLLAGLLVTWIVHKRRSWLSFILTSIILAGVVAASVLLFRVNHLVFIPTGLIATVFVIYPLLSTISYWQHERHHRWLRRTFGAMVSDKVLSYLEANPKGSATEGRKTEATVLFSDIKGFTTISESLEPDSLSHLMNVYFSRMEGIIRQRDGYVDKFVGDAIMAEWGVPYYFDRHADLACEAALDMVAALKEIQPEIVARCGSEISIRIGINTGHVTAGNMGSRERFNFTVMGDTVNLTDRLEKLNKEYGTTIIVSEFTRAAVMDRFEFRALGRVVVKGKTQAVEVFELVGRKGPGEPR